MKGTWLRRWLKRRTPVLLGVVAAIALVSWAIVRLPHREKTHAARLHAPFYDTGSPIPGSGPTVARFPSPSAIPVGESLRRGETLSQVFGRLGLDRSEAYAATQALASYANPRDLRAGDDYSAYFDHNAQLAKFRLTLERRGEVRLSRSSQGWRSQWYPYERTQRLRRLSGQIQEGDSLESAIARAGGDPALAYAMADVLQWDMDFTRDLRVGDRFSVLYQEVYLDGTYDSIGDIEALSFENRGDHLEAYRYGKDGDYFGPDGRPLKKMFLRAPLRYTRITSRFSNRRFHPILHRFLPHHGVDYGAPIGTPVRVTANGTVIFRGWDRGGGRAVKVRHSQGYVTEYLHLSRYARGIHRGVRVHQGELVGFVGESGLATGPHLDYRIKHYGHWINPLSIKGARMKPIAASRLPAFKRWRDALRAELDGRAPLGLPATASGDRVATASPRGNEPQSAPSGR